MEYSLGYREVIPDQTVLDKWKEIVINTGGSQSTLQDIKVPERAGGYSYQDSFTFLTRNRFIYWRTMHDIIELVEESLDINLTNNRVRYKFTDTPILDGVSIHESIDSVIILIITVSSIHKMSFSHPKSIHNQEENVPHVGLTMQSIFSDASIKKIRDPHTFHLIPSLVTTNPPVAHTGTSCLKINSEEALFALAYNSGAILLLRMDSVTNLVHANELKQESVVPRFLSGLATAFRARSLDTEIAMSLVMHVYDNDIFLFSLSRGGYLRTWSCNKAQYLTGINVAVNNHNFFQHVQTCALKKSIDLNHEVYFCAYLKFNSGCEFSILKLVDDSRTFKFYRLHTILAPDQHLIDFCFSNTRLWAVWRTTDADSIDVTHIRLSSDNGYVNNIWESAILIQSPDKDYVMSDGNIDPRQAYINYIFHPGKFSMHDITRALSIYRKSNYLTATHLSPNDLKNKVCLAVEAEIQSEVVDYELMDEDYLEIVNRCWSRFYSCVLQYHLNRSRPLGLLLLPSVIGVILLKKSSFSMLRPMEALEHLTLLNDKSFSSLFSATPVLCQDENICSDLIILMSALTKLDKYLSEDIKSNFEKQLYHLKSPDAIVDNLPELLFDVDECFTDFDLKSEFYHNLEIIQDISSTVAMLLEALTYDLGQPNKLKFNAKILIKEHKLKNLQNLFASDLGVSTVAESVTQITILRFSICRNLLILQSFITSRSEFFDSQSLHTIRSSLMPRTVILTQAYYVIMWISAANTSIASSQALKETSIQRLSLLKLYDSKLCTQLHQNRSFSLLELFTKYSITNLIYKLIVDSSIDLSSIILWQNGLLSYVTIIAQLVWSISDNFIFPEWLLSSSQFLLVQEYVRLLSSWCEWNSASRKFIFAVSLLEVGETQKACDYFLRASNGVLIDSFLSELIFTCSVTSESSALVLYYLKVIEMFEQHNASDCIIELALTAITVAECNDPNLPTLHSIVFTQHLNLQHHLEAYNCLHTNPDHQRRVDCLRLLVLALFQRKKLSALISFPYVDMYSNLEKIMESRARSVDLQENNYYDFLYSFHINKGNMRKAASIMYEQAIRLGQEPHSLLIISKMTYCLLTCINTLHLVSEKYRWIVRPIINLHSIQDKAIFRKKRSVTGEEVLQLSEKKKIEVLDLMDIQKEYYLAEAKLTLAKLNPENYISIQSCPLEIVIALCNAGLYLKALNICKSFKLCKTSIVESLTLQCIKLNQNSAHQVWNWLNYNNDFDSNISSLNPVTISWNILQYVILSHENNEKSILHKEVSRTLYHRGLNLPHWLLSSYAKRNAAELLRLMIQMGRLEEAISFAVEYINAHLGRGSEYFGLETCLLANSSSVCLPCNTIEILLAGLNHASKTEKSYFLVYNELQNTLKKYYKSVKRVSKDMIELKIHGI